MNKILRWFPAIIWMMVIFYFSGQQTTGVTGTHSIGFISIYWQRYIILKSFHLGEYAFLFLLVSYATKKTPTSFLVSYVYACSDEIHQRYTPGRTSRFSDTLIDLIGITLGFIISKAMIYFYSKQTQKKILQDKKA